jgi:hypothetical protein
MHPVKTFCNTPGTQNNTQRSDVDKLAHECLHALHHMPDKVALTTLEVPLAAQQHGMHDVTSQPHRLQVM